MIGTRIYLIDNDHLRAFGQPRTVDAGNIFATNGIPYGLTRDGRDLRDQQCDEYTDKKSF